MADLVEDLIGERILISPGRAARPYDFRSTPEERRANCPFCPGHEAQTPPEVLAERAGGEPNDSAWTVRVVPNLYPAVPAESVDGGVFGIHEAIIESARHEARLGDLSDQELTAVLRAWRSRFVEARKDKRLRYGLVFKNQGPNAGASLEHPHSQFIALPFVPERASAEAKAFRRGRYEVHVRGEMDSLEHLVASSRRLAAITPAASRFSHQLWLMPRMPEAQFEACDDGMLEETATLLGRLLKAMDRMLSRPDYHLMIHTAPFGDDRYWWRIELFPRLNKVAGFEWATGIFLNQTDPKDAARAWRQELKD